ncbi:megakaryocyte-associated tyrosine-protein kinase [Histomonas meleagridis]|uniref:megakaryocyte-associated tyrosine-protein kinase n=1 Tax=Histomonas meleagridis TaxID=135588 RepID=UPI00355AADC4|nr:megakaryocyte-associated tyrosine-protein kinase [Histomonas meleagridis]KAH0796689.1 megakaryocyte-associated tyrosine-protein kinase [Histomonas meleagridis]
MESDFTKVEKERLFDNLDLFQINSSQASTDYYDISIGMIKYTGQQVVMKKSKSLNAQKSLVDEFKELCSVAYPTVQSVVGLYLGKNHEEATLITPFYEKGTISNIIQAGNTTNINFNLTSKIIVIIGISFGMQYLHQKEIIHRHLTAKNIYIGEQFHPIISGFANSMDISIEAPEIINGNEYTKETDVYAFGLLMYEIFTGHQPYQGLTPDKIQENLTNGVLPEMPLQIPQAYATIIRECLSKDPNNRPTFQTISNNIIAAYTDRRFRGINIAIVDEYKNLLLDSEICPLNNFVIPTPLFSQEGVPFPERNEVKIPIKINEFEAVIRKAGDRPIVLVMLFGPYQSGKSTYLKTLTGNAAFYAGKGVRSQTQGILIDGPYYVSDLIERLGTDYVELQEKCNSLNVNPDTALFFIDSQGIGDKRYEEELKPILDKVNALFTSISTICLTICESNVEVGDIQTILTTIRRAQLSKKIPFSKVYFLVKGWKDLENVLDVPNPDEYQHHVRGFSEQWMNEHNIAKELYAYDSLYPLPLGNNVKNLPGYINSVYQSLYYMLDSIKFMNYNQDLYINSLKNAIKGLFFPQYVNWLDAILNFEHDKIPNTLNSALKHCCNCCLLLSFVILDFIHSGINGSYDVDIILMNIKTIVDVTTEYVLPYILGEDKIPFNDFYQFYWEIYRDLLSYVKYRNPEWGKIMKEGNFLQSKKWVMTAGVGSVAFAVAFIPVVGTAASLLTSFGYVLGMQIKAYLLRREQKKIVDTLATTIYPYIWERNIEEINPKIITLNKIPSRKGYTPDMG